MCVCVCVCVCVTQIFDTAKYLEGKFTLRLLTFTRFIIKRLNDFANVIKKCFEQIRFIKNKL